MEGFFVPLMGALPQVLPWQTLGKLPHINHIWRKRILSPQQIWTKVVMLALSQIEATEKQVPQHRDSFGVHLAWPCHLSSLVQISHRCLAQRLWQWSHPGPPAKIGFMKISCSQELSVLVSTDVCFFHRYSPRTPKWETTHHLPRSAD